MQLTLTLDIGNTNPHVGWFVDGTLKKVSPLSELSERAVDATGARKITAITSHVGSNHDLSWLSPHEVVSWRNIKGFLGMPFKYAGTLGADRLVQIFYLRSHRREKCALIDAGTFTTIDLMDETGHHGGIIIPGLDTYLETFKRKGAKLPKLTVDQVDFSKPATLFALNTFDAIAEGYKLLLTQCQLQLQCVEPQNVILTGGHGELLKPLFPGSAVEPHLIHHSLYACLQSAQSLGIA